LSPAEFVCANTALTAPPLVPEVRLHLAVEILPLWRKSEGELQEMGVPPPYWAFAWAGGQALARYVLDNPESVRGKSVLDVGSGSGIVAIAAARAGAAAVLAADIDPYAAAAIALNARANGVNMTTTTQDMIGGATDCDLILCGDMCYDKPLAERLIAWLRESRADVLIGDPGRSYFPETGTERMALYNVRVTRDLEDREIRQTGVYRLRDCALSSVCGHD
jgi:predicted nicotinamide N-methyase